MWVRERMFIYAFEIAEDLLQTSCLQDDLHTRVVLRRGIVGNINVCVWVVYHRKLVGQRALKQRETLGHSPRVPLMIATVPIVCTRVAG